MLRRLKGDFIAGLAVLLPIGITGYILYRGFLLFDSILKDIIRILLFKFVGIEYFRDHSLPGIGIITLIILTILAGAVAKNIIGRRIIALGDRWLARIPLFNRIYKAISQIIKAVFSQSKTFLERPVLIEYPRQGMYCIAFVTQDTRGAVQDSLKEDVVSVFLPTTPNPTSGFLLFVPKESVIKLNINVEDALKLVISGGTLTPENSET